MGKAGVRQTKLKNNVSMRKMDASSVKSTSTKMVHDQKMIIQEFWAVIFNLKHEADIYKNEESGLPVQLYILHQTLINYQPQSLEKKKYFMWWRQFY